ncbi:MAG TPA: TIGR00730 family Rossman fold protein [Cytophagales bacterium]|nr:TIGR00730 family Rossman fold protein [Cytophagales bacterium]
MNLCVFCGSRKGTRPEFERAANKIGRLMAECGITLVYGGGNIGLMGVLADAVLAGGGQVIGVIPDFLMQREVGHRGVTQLEIVGSMHERKRRMADLADAFVALPGGWGTLDELAEILTWKQLGLVSAPVGLLNTHLFFNPLLAQMQDMVTHGFLDQPSLQNLLVETEERKLLERCGLIRV